MKRCVATTKGRSKKVLDQFEFDNNQHGIQLFVHRMLRHLYTPAIAIFESTGNYWKVLHNELEKTSIKPILVNPYDLKIITQAKFKDDRVDSERLSDLARGDLYKPSYVPTQKEMDLRELTRTRLSLRRDATRHKNHVHAILVKYPLEWPALLYTTKGKEWLKNAPIRDYDRMTLDSHLDILDTTEKRIVLLEQEICRIATTDPQAMLLMTMPGVGPITAVTVLAEIGDISRFIRSEQMTSYAGLVPSHRNSADTVRTGGITKRGSTWLRNAVVEAAFVATRHDPPPQDSLRAVVCQARHTEGAGCRSPRNARGHVVHANQERVIQPSQREYDPAQDWECQPNGQPEYCLDTRDDLARGQLAAPNQ